MTLPEVMLWKVLRGNQIEGVRFRRQHPSGPYILDFYCAALKLAIEIDGAGHDDELQAVHDRKRDAWLASNGISVMRFNASDILDEKRRDDVLATIAAWQPPPPPPAVPLPRIAGED
jgi:very-short-patch-repair endonuclease